MYVFHINDKKLDIPAANLLRLDVAAICSDNFGFNRYDDGQIRIRIPDKFVVQVFSLLFAKQIVVAGMFLEKSESR